MDPHHTARSGSLKIEHRKLMMCRSLGTQLVQAAHQIAVFRNVTWAHPKSAVLTLRATMASKIKEQILVAAKTVTEAIGFVAKLKRSSWKY